MSSTVIPPRKQVAHYPDSDGQPMSDNTLQFTWIGILKWGLEAYYLKDPNIFIAGDHLIYPVEGDPKTRQAPDVYVAFGRPKHDRGSYKVWEEAGLFPQVVFEVWSPNNRFDQMQDKYAFYEKFGVEEYYIVYPEFPAHVEGWKRDGAKLSRISEINEWVSPRTGIRFSLKEGYLSVFGPDGREMKSPAEIAADRDAEYGRAEQERHRAEQIENRARTAEERAAQLAARLRELGVDPDKV
jgi:Uma2 family endonuclease